MTDQSNPVKKFIVEEDVSFVLEKLVPIPNYTLAYKETQYEKNVEKVVVIPKGTILILREVEQ